MLTYILRRVLYSIPVLIATSFLIFAGVTLDRRSARRAQGEPARLRADDRAHRAEEAPQRHPPRAVRLLGEGRGHEQVRYAAPHQPADLGRPEANPSAHARARHPGGAHGPPAGGRDRDLLGDTPVLGLRLRSDHDISFLGFAMPVFWLALMLQIAFTNLFLAVARPDLLHLGALLTRRRGWVRLVRRPRPAPGDPVDDAHAPVDRGVQPLHARLAARGREHGLRTDGARQGPHRAARDHAPRRSQRPHPRRHARCDSTSAF